MFCSNCGKEISDNAKFCQYCGYSFNVENDFKIQNDEIAANKIKQNSNNPISGCLSAIVIIFIFAFFFNDSDIFSFFGETNEGKSNSLEVIESHTCNLEYGAIGVCGTVENKSDRNFGYAEVEINLYNKSGELIGSTLDNINNIEPHGKWKFQAPIIENNVATYKIKNITGL